MQSRLGIQEGAPASTWPVADYHIARRYNYGDKFVQGPDHENPLIDWQFPDITRWTKACTNPFIRDFFLQYKAKKPSTSQNIALKMEDVERSFHICLLVMKDIYRKNKSAINYPI
jgi:hypothetical protein